jgi:hypothetical protein
MYPQRCTDSRPHGPHYVAPRGYRTGFTCPGPAGECDLPPADFEHLVPVGS